FTNLRIGPSGHESLSATNGHISWHFDWDSGKFIIDELRANQLRVNLALKDNKLDFGALSPLLKGGGQKLEIGKISLGLGEIFLTTNYGLANVRFNIGGKLEDFAGNAEIILPNGLYFGGAPSEAIKVNFRNRDLANGNTKAISAHISANNQNYDFNKLLGANERGKALGVSANIALGVAIDGNGETFIAFRRSQIAASEVHAADANFDNLAINFSDANWQHNGNWAHSAIFDLAAELSAARAQILGQSIAKANWNLNLKRGTDKKLNLEYRLSHDELRGIIAAQSLVVNGALSGQANDLSQIRGIQFEGSTNIIARNLVAAGSQNFAEIARNLRAEDLLTQSSANLHFNLRGNLDDFAISPIGAQRVSGARGSQLNFAPTPAASDSNAIYVRSLDGISQISGAWSGRVDLRSSTNGTISAQMNESSFNSTQSHLNLSQINLRNLEYADFTLNGVGGRAQFALLGNRISSGLVSANLLASSNGDLKLAQSPINLNLSVQNNRAQFSAGGRIANAAFDGNIIQNANFNITGNAVLANGRTPTSISSDIRASVVRFVAKNGAHAENFSIAGPFQALMSSDSISLNGRHCLQTSIDEMAFDDNSIHNAQGALCPDSHGRFAVFENGHSHLYATTNISALDLQLGSSGTANRISMAGLTGRFSQAPEGGILYVATVPNLEFRFNTGPETHATIRASDSRLTLHSRAGTTNLTADLREIKTEGLPVRTSGNMIMDMAFNDVSGTLGHFSFNNLLVSDIASARRYADLGLSGTGDLRNNQIYFEGNLVQAQSGASVATARLNHNLQTGIGNAVIDGNGLRFKPRLVRTGPRDGFEIGELLPTLHGIFTDVEGSLAGRANFNWAPNVPVVSSAEIGSTALNFNTIIGQVENLAGTIRIDDLLGLKTSTQIIRVGSFNPGIPILNGVLGFSLPGTNALKIEAASWPFADGDLSIEPSIWPFNNQDKSLTIKVDNIDIAQLLRLTNIPNLVIDGRMSGILPVKIIENNAEIVGGVLRAREGGGTIKYTGPSLAAAPPPPTSREKLQNRLGMPSIPKNEALAEAALRNLQYKVLEIRVDGRITGDMTLGITIEG
ncbi:MAG: YdbH domain-containing protein, partial [Pseudomonadota bacterium]